MVLVAQQVSIYLLIGIFKSNLTSQQIHLNFWCLTLEMQVSAQNPFPAKCMFHSGLSVYLPYYFHSIIHNNDNQRPSSSPPRLVSYSSISPKSSLSSSPLQKVLIERANKLNGWIRRRWCGGPPKDNWFLWFSSSSDQHHLFPICAFFSSSSAYVVWAFNLCCPIS